MSEVAHPCHSMWEAERLQFPGQPGLHNEAVSNKTKPQCVLFAVQPTQWLPSLCSSIETQDEMERN